MAIGIAATPALALMPGAPILSSPRASAGERKNIAIGRIEGPKSTKIRLALMAQIKDSGSFSVTDAEDLKSTAGKATIAKMAGTLQVDAVVLGVISNRSDLTLSVYKADGGLVEQVKVRGGSSKKLEQAVATEFDDSIAPALAEASGGSSRGAGAAAAAAAAPAAEEEAEPEAPPPKSETTPSAAEVPPEETTPIEPAAGSEADASEGEKKSKKGESKPGRTPLELELGLRGYSRSFEYTDPVGPRDTSIQRTLEPYKLGFAPSVLFSGVFYPGAFWDDGVLGNLGIMGRFEVGFATSTDYQLKEADGSTVNTTLKTKVQAWDAGLRGRIPIGPVEIALFAEYGMQTFILYGDEGKPGELPPLVPDVQYMFVRLGVEPSLRLGNFSVSAHVAPRLLTSLHNIDLEKVWFPGATGNGLDFGATVGYGVTSFLDVVAGFDYVSYGFDFNNVPTDPTLAPLVAGGATDRYISGRLGVRFRIGGR
jgi:hypothetical protein